MVAVANPENEHALFGAYLAATEVWGAEYSDALRSFGKGSFEDVKSDIMTYCIMILTGAKVGVEADKLLYLGM